MNKSLVIALASVFAAGSAAAAGLGHVHSMARDGATAMRHDVSGISSNRVNNLILKSNGADDPAGDNRRGRGKDDLIMKRNGADDPAGDVRRGRGKDDLIMKRNGADDPAGDDRRGRRLDDGPNHH